VYILEERQAIVSVASMVAINAISAMNRIFSSFHPTVTVDIKYNAPSVPSLGIPSITGGTSGNAWSTLSAMMKNALSSIGANFQHGGIALKNMVANVGEGNRPEMIAPLSERALRPFASVIVSEMQNILNSRATTQAQGGTPVYVGTLIADKAGMRELERRRYKIALAESLRRGD